MLCRHCKKERSEHYGYNFCPDQDESYVNDWCNNNGDWNEDDRPVMFAPQWPKFLNVYEQHQQYGGCEEGGWWYFSGEPIESVRVDNQSEYDVYSGVLRMRYHLTMDGDYSLKGQRDNPEYNIERSRGATSCAGGYDVVIRTEYQFAKDYPDRTPHYE